MVLMDGECVGGGAGGGLDDVEEWEAGWEGEINLEK